MGVIEESEVGGKAGGGVGGGARRRRCRCIGPWFTPDRGGAVSRLGFQG
jgi:hypothetical protein